MPFSRRLFKWIFLNENGWIFIKILLKFVPNVPINNIPALVQIMAWRRSGDKPLSEPMMDSLLTQICVTRPQWLNFKLRLANMLLKIGYEWVRHCMPQFAWILLLTHALYWAVNKRDPCILRFMICGLIICNRWIDNGNVHKYTY